MTLVNDDETTPGWKKSQKFLKNNKNVIIETGIDKTGDIFSYHAIINFAVITTINKFEIITADGGFDFSIDFNNQEIISNKLI